ncbi:3-deoxy-8-phosphooctulonate synthase [Quatrionicoccus australiensis]|uniref:3-deoxy-8-phosphooctulonate synthase n=1 Tax=Quatrionicoccus australiensis TaxID=138118 RepID=UPI001CFC31CF|nr:3-deoxy-8-phosphooctulonate synthase [Quatrionicoccus australiensis]MCB4358674.1 3-deoxy-8-phosphooctulonate synthase [Quatrionicoccus australiensis]
MKNSSIFEKKPNELFFISGPCAIESRSFALETAEELKEIFSNAGLKFVYKSSFDKANRSSNSSFRGVGIEHGLSILDEIRNKFEIPVLTDVHETWQIKEVASVVDAMQTPAFLCRQTDFIEAIASAGKPVNFKKGQFLSPWDMKNVLEKARAAAKSSGVPYDHFAVCERGTTFGYGNLVVDMRGLQIMSETTEAPVIFDATHSVQLPGANGVSSGGQRQYVPHLARAAVATGAVSGVFMETHPDPDRAPCDGPNMLHFSNLPNLLAELKSIYCVVNSK